MAQDPIEQLFIELALKSDKFNKDVDDALAKAGKKVAKTPLPVPMGLDTTSFDKEVNKALTDYKQILKKSLGVVALTIDTKQTEKGVKDAVAVFMAQVPKLQKAGVIDLSVAKDKLKASLEDAIRATTQQINASGVKGPGVDFAKNAGAQLASQIVGTLAPAEAATAKVNKGMAGMAAVARNTGQAMITNFAATRDPIQTMTAGIEAANVGLAALNATGVVTDAVLSPLIAVLAALAAGAAILTAALGPVISFLKQTGAEGQQLAARIETQWVGVRVAANNAGISFDIVKKKIEQLEATGITTTEALGDTMKFLTNQLPIADMDKLARAAQNVAVAFAADSSETMNRFVDAITTGNTQLLQSVGITETATQMQERYALAIGTTVGNLTVAQQKEAIMAGIMRDAQSYTGLYAESMESLGKQIGSLPRYIEQGTAAFGQTLLPFLQQSVQQATDFWKTFQSLFVQMKETTDAEGTKKLTPVTNAQGQPQLTQAGQQIHDAVLKMTQATQPLFDAFIKILPVAVARFADLVTVSQKAGTAMQPLAHIAANIVDIMVKWTQTGGSIAKALLSIPFPDFLKNLLGVNNALELVGKGFSFMGEMAAASIGGVVGLMTTATDAVDNFFSVLTGHGTKGNWAQWVQDGKNAAKQIHDNLVDLGNIKITPVVEPTVQLGAGGGMPNQQAMLNLQQETEAFRQFQQLQDSFQDQSIESQHQYEQQSLASARQFNRQIEDGIYNRTQGELRAERDANLQKTYMARDAAIALRRSLEDYDTQTFRSNLQRRKQFNRQQVIDEQAHLIEMRRLNEDFGMNMEDAVRNRDARTVLNLMRQHKVEVSRKEEDFGRSRDLAKQQLEVEIQDQQVQRDYVIEDAKKNMARQQQDFEQNLKDQKAARAQAYADQLTDQIHQQAVEAQRRKDDYAIQLKEQEYQHGIQMEHLVRQWAENASLNAEGAKQLLTVLDGFYGAHGRITALLDGFMKKVNDVNKKLAGISTAVGPLNTSGGGGGSSVVGQGVTGTGAGQEGPPGAPNKPTTSCGFGFEWQWDTGLARWKCKPRRVRAAGGLDIASRPTTVTFGDAGREAALFLPMGDGHIPLPKLMGMIGGAGGGAAGRTDHLSVSLAVQAQGSLGPEAADQIFTEIAQIMATQIGIRIEGR